LTAATAAAATKTNYIIPFHCNFFLY